MKKLLAMTAIALLALSANVFAQDGKVVYEKACQVCHSIGVANAPKAFDASVWQPKLEMGIDKLVKTVQTGKGAMPPGGMCMDCSADDLKNAIEYMAKPQ